jgi:hypothetical protein
MENRTDITKSDIHQTSPQNSLTNYEPANVRRALTDKLMPSESVELVAKLLCCWPNSNDDSKGYIGALAAILRDYPRCVSVKCADPMRGVARDVKFRPTVADLVWWCERELVSLRAIVDRDDEKLRWEKQRDEAAERERARIAKFKSPEDAERVKAKLAETLESLGKALGKKTAAVHRAEAQETLARCEIEATEPGATLSVSSELAKIMRGVDDDFGFQVWP